MRRFSRRFYLILLLSLLCLLLTQYWYEHTEITTSERAGVPVAYIKERKNLVESKQYDHLIWKDVRMGQPLFRGDAVRTNLEAQSEVVFTKSGATILLNGDSQMVIDERQGEMSLRLISGSLLARGDITAPPVVVGQSVIHLEKQKTEIAVAVNEKKEAVGCVYNGEMGVSKGASSKEKYQSGNCSSNKLLLTTMPKPNEVIGRASLSGTSRFEFVGPENTEYEADLFLGKKTRELNKVATTRNTKSKGVIVSPVPEGEFYWMVKTRKGNEELARSPIYRSMASTARPPTLIGPKDNIILSSLEEKYRLTLSWTSSVNAKNFKIEISKDPNFKKDMVYVGETEKYQTQVLLTSGFDYYWRVTTLWKDESILPMTSLKQKVTITSYVKLASPQVLSPQSGVTIPFRTISSEGLMLRWGAVNGAKSYTVLVTSRKLGVFKYQTNDPFYRLKLSEPADYKWTVQADRDRSSSQLSEYRNIIVVPYLPVAWLSPKFSELMVETEKPLAKLRWQSLSNVRQWSLSYSNPVLKKSTSLKLTRSGLDLELPDVGSWEFQVLGYGASNDVIAQSDVLKVKFTHPVELLPPVLSGVSNYYLKGNYNGSFSVNWNAIGRGKTYILVLKEPNGKQRKIETNKTEYTFSDLPVGIYFLQLATKNSMGKKGPDSKIYQIDIPKDPGAPPPKIQRVIVR